jgi:hypothetical protein
LFLPQPDRKVDIKNNQLGIKLIPIISNIPLDPIFPVRNEAHHAERLVNPKVRGQNQRLQILDTPEHVDSENIKLNLTNFF